MHKSIFPSIMSILLPAIMAALITVPSFASERYELVTEWGSSGSEDGQFYEGGGLAIDRDNNLYLSDTHLNHRIQKFTPDGEFIASWGNYGSGDGEFIAPRGIDVDDEGNVYVGDFLNDRVQKFTSDGEFIAKWSTQVEGVWLYSTPSALTVDNRGNVYVFHKSLNSPTLFYNSIQKFTTDGIFIMKWAFIWLDSVEMSADSDGNLYAPAALIGPVQVFNSEGELVDELKTCSPTETLCTNTGIAIDNEGNVYVSDRVHHHVKKFTRNGDLITKWELESPGGFGSNPSPYALAVDSAGNVYVIDNANIRILKYAKVSDTTTTTTTICPSENIYGEDSEALGLLRQFRDEILKKTPEGKEIIHLYYEWSPLIVMAMEKDEQLKRNFKEIIDGILPMIQ